MKWLVEFEGYSLSFKFIFKEVTFLNISNTSRSDFFIKAPFPFSYLSTRDKKIVRYCEQNLHKLHWSSGSMSYADLSRKFSNIKQGDTVFTKGLQKVELLKSILHNKPDIVNLEDLGCMSAKLYICCNDHSQCKLLKHKNELQCSVKKAIAFSRFLSSNHESVIGSKHRVFDAAEGSIC